MATVSGTLRRQVLAPALDSVGFAHRGFPVRESAVTRRLEAIPRSVICGFEWGLEVRHQREVEHRLELLEPELQGFGYEGATMACTVRDVMGTGRARRTERLLRGPGERHLFLAYIGIGFAMARLPRPLWRRVLPDLSGNPYHPTMSWLAVDGYGFDRAYFDTRRWVTEQFQPQPYPWTGWPSYFLRAVDQGIGRALWFIHGADPVDVVAAVRRFAPQRQPDLWSGVGLAATFAGGGGPAELALVRQAAGDQSRDLGQGAVFAAKARDYSGVVPPHTEPAVHALAGLSVAEAVVLADGAAADDAPPDSVPPYEIWRRRIRSGLPPR